MGSKAHIGRFGAVLVAQDEAFPRAPRRINSKETYPKKDFAECLAKSFFIGCSVF
jgi:hypothetical protein